jgi:hypothetical protein
MISEPVTFPIGTVACTLIAVIAPGKYNGNTKHTVGTSAFGRVGKHALVR